ncbi:MAG: tetratricopeptide repeat protein [Candidatus Latescibacteria bacterium]|nr:tetratricopeptide repeat protein [Candidatus Latescibacterota bacterium]
MSGPAPPPGWIINRPADLFFFIGTPLICLGVLLLASLSFRSADIALFVLAFFAVGHHLPGLMRAYGEKELFARYKARFIVTPFLVAALVGWSVFNGHLGFFIFLALWDLWHFFMQHFGFMRIYELKRRRPTLLSARLDWLLSAAWLGYVVIASPHYLINFLERCQRYGFGLYTWISPEWVGWLRSGMLVATVGITVLYLLNLGRERRQGVPIVWPKLAITAITFGTSYYAYIVLQDILLGYAIIAMAHDIQYYAIVWIYNHGVLRRSEELGASFFRFLFRDGRFRIVLFYAVLILAYGGIEVVARSTQNYLIYDVVKVLIATSAFLHYYYDGFMWKVRRKEIRQNLAEGAEGTGEASWRVRGRAWLEAGQQRWAAVPYLFETGKQLVYFGVPIVFLAWTDASYSLSEMEAREYLVRLTPSVAKSHDDLGVAYTRKGLLDQAIAAYQQAIALDPDWAPAHTHLGIVLSLKGQREQAIRQHLEAIQLDSGLAQARYNLGVEYFQAGQLAQARTAFEQAIGLDASYGHAYYALGQVFLKQGKSEEATPYLARAKELEQAAKRRRLGQSAMPWATGTPLEDS